MKTRERFDKILCSCCDRIQDEVAALIGKPFKLGEPQFRQIGKKDLFVEPAGKQVLAHIRIDGELQGEGCLLVGIKDAIRIGGTLIMLPESELEIVMGGGEYSDELQDSFGEIANIICGAITVTFEEQYPKNTRFFRTELEVITPIKVVAESGQPIAEGPYYVMTAPMQLDGKDLGGLEVVLPAIPFGLTAAAAKEKEKTVAEPATAKAATVAEPKETPEPVGTIEREEAGRVDIEDVGVLERPEAEGQTVQSDRPIPPKRDIAKQKILIDNLLKTSMEKTCDEVSALLGGTLKVVPAEHTTLSKEHFLEQAGGKQVMTRMKIRGGEGQNEAFLFVDVKTAVYLGGTLIMLPEGEIEETVRKEEFGDDASDAYGEVTNIIAGVFTSIFEEQYRGKLGFMKTSMETVTPVKVDPESDDTIPNLVYYLSDGQIQYNGKDLRRLQILIPASVLELEGLFKPEEEPEADDATRGKPQEATPSKGTAPSDPTRLQEKPPEPTDILIFTDDDNEGGRIAAALEQMGNVPRILHFKDSVNSVLTPRIQMIFLVMQEVSEQGFGVAIKISSAGLRVPLVAAGPAWTRTLVLKAVKYGACDILITPSSPADVREKIEINLVKRAA